MNKSKLMHIAKKRVRKKRRYFVHLALFISTGVFLLVMNIITFSESNEWWFFHLLIPWGAILLFRYLVIFGFPVIGILSNEWQDKQLIREFRRLKSINPLQNLKKTILKNRINIKN